jgi:hypothetical protein
MLKKLWADLQSFFRTSPSGTTSPIAPIMPVLEELKTRVEAIEAHMIANSDDHVFKYGSDETAAKAAEVTGAGSDYTRY